MADRQLVFDEDDDMDDDEEGIIPTGPAKETAETPQDIFTPLPTTPSHAPTTISASDLNTALQLVTAPSTDPAIMTATSTHLVVPPPILSSGDPGPSVLGSTSAHTPAEDEERSHTPKLEDLSDVEPEEDRDAEAEDDDDRVVTARTRHGLLRREGTEEEGSFGVTSRDEEEEGDEDDEDDIDDDDLDEEMLDEDPGQGAGGFETAGGGMHDSSYNVAAGMMQAHHVAELAGLGGLGDTPGAGTEEEDGGVRVGVEGGDLDLEDTDIDFGGHGTGGLSFGELQPQEQQQVVEGQGPFGEEGVQGGFGIGN
ncbi:hypothetical protein BC938DRAFT_478047 [Jimgerdemannia flammicorona]|uniref:Uncharacterized protein n=1 Tax=Jimgerdemannia flammicorona TaxID=994334 RepID=A0A433P6J7_9FUNG|nr:hypothetical protein BC938DRAFT_478047 [Jimgerdemannia flammicorona]